MSSEVTAEVTLVEAETLADELNSDTLLLVQVTSGEVYQQAHLPGAVLVTPAELICGIPPATGKLPDKEQLVNLLDRIGYTPERDVVVYDDEGGGWAGRFGWTLDCLGHRHWRYLNGGLQAWAAAGLDFQNGQPQTIEASSNTGLAIDRKPIAEIADVLEAIEDASEVILDVRSREEYLGQKQASARAGHIPAAVNYDWLLMKDPEDAQRLAEDLQTRLSSIGVDGSRPIITHCQTHHRSGLSYMVGRLFGYDIRAYHGSWSEWGNRDDTPIDNPSAGTES